MKTSLYVHLPWCKTKCPYCDFNSFKSKADLKEKYYVDSLLEDLARELQYCPDRAIDSIYFGGGTPSLFSGISIEQLLDGINQKIKVNAYSEITLEVNPESANKKNLRQYLEAGVNRISLGVQSFSDSVLSALARPHSSEEALTAYYNIREAGFENVNVDLMYGVPKGSSETDLADLNAVVNLHPEHISWYQLTIEEGTRFFVCPPTLPVEEEIYRSFRRGFDLLRERGYQQYEISAFSLPGKTSNHNLHYWNYGDYIGIGAGAHGKLTLGGKIYRSEKEKNPELYMAKISDGCEITERKYVSESESLLEYLINATRLVDGFNITELCERTGIRPDSTDLKEKLEKAIDKGLLTWKDDLIKPTHLGRLFLNDLQLLFL